MISDTELLAYIRPASVEDIDVLRRLEKAAVAMIQKRTGRFFGVSGVVTEELQWRGWPMALSASPTALTTFQSWDGSAWAAVDASTYYLSGSFIYLQAGNSSWTPLSMPTRYKVTYTGGYTDLGGEEWEAPEDIKQAVIMLVGHWFENREAVVVGASSSGELPMAVSALIDGHIRVAV